MSDTPSSLATAVDAVLRTKDADLETWLRERAAEGKGLRDLAFDIRVETGIPVSHETLRRWVRHYGVAETAA